MIAPYLNDPHVQQMKNYIQHGNITTYRHVVNVVKTAYFLDKKYGLGADPEILLPAALLHDFYLYDWHKTPMFDLHGYRHPKRAAEKAASVFDPDEAVLSAIRTHMWPLTLFKIPRSREAWIICITSLAETLWMRSA